MCYLISKQLEIFLSYDNLILYIILLWRTYSTLFQWFRGHGSLSCVHAYVFLGLNPCPLTCYGITPPWSYMLLFSGMLYDLYLIQMITGIDVFLFFLLVIFISEDKLKSLLVLLVFLLPLLWSSSVECTAYMTDCGWLAD